MSARQPPGAEYCATCAEITGTKRYCARSRCYCGHEDCPAFDSYVDLSQVPLAIRETSAPRGISSWDSREGPTWIDSL